jgi:hypothetical protein
MSVSVYAKKCYGNLSHFQTAKNKANLSLREQSQFEGKRENTKLSIRANNSYYDLQFG